MCEFKVYLNNTEILEDVVRVKYVDGKMELTTVLGEKKELEDAMIIQVDVSKERLEVIQNSMIGALLKFLRLYDKVIREQKYHEELECALDDIKAIGDSLVRKTWKNYVKR